MDLKISTPRKKSCASCSKSKVRCDLKRPVCTRCKTRSVECIYAESKPSERDVSNGDSTSPQYNALPIPAPAPTAISATDTLDFDRVHLVCTVDEHRLRGRWLESLLPSAYQRPKDLNASTVGFCARIFKSYPGMFQIEGVLPPFIHWSQATGKICEPLANCMNIGRMWANQSAGGENMVQDVIEQEMARLYQKESTRLVARVEFHTD